MLHSLKKKKGTKMNGPHHLLGAFLQSAVCVVVVSRPSLLFFFSLTKFCFCFLLCPAAGYRLPFFLYWILWRQVLFQQRAFVQSKKNVAGCFFSLIRRKSGSSHALNWQRCLLFNCLRLLLFALNRQETTGRCEVSRHEILSTPWRSLLRLFHTSALSSWTLSSYSFLYST